MPRLLIRISISGNCRTVAAVPLSTASFSSFADGTLARMSAMAASTLAGVRPLIITVTPSRARVVAIFFADAASRGGDKGECVIELKVHEGLFPQRNC